MKELDRTCSFSMACSVIGGKWKPFIIMNLGKSKKRFGQLHASIPGISRKVLSTHLNELVNDKLIERKAFAETPPRVEYNLTVKGKELLPIYKLVAKWGEFLVEK